MTSWCHSLGIIVIAETQLKVMLSRLVEKCEILVLVQSITFTNSRAFHKSNLVKLNEGQLLPRVLSRSSSTY